MKLLLPLLSSAGVSLSFMMMMIWIMTTSMMLMMIPLTTIVHAEEGDTGVQPCDESHEDIKDLIFDVWGDREEWDEYDGDGTYYCAFGKGSSSGMLEDNQEAKSETMTCFYGIPNYYYATVEYQAEGYDDFDLLEPESLTVTTTYYIYGTDIVSSSGQMIIDFTGGSDCFDTSAAPVYFDSIKYRIENPDDIELPSDDPSFSPLSDFPSDITPPPPPPPSIIDDDCNMHDEIVALLNNEFGIENCLPSSSISSEGGEYIHDCEMEVTDTIGIKNVTATYTANNVYDANDEIVVIPNKLFIVQEYAVPEGVLFGSWVTAESVDFVNDCTEDDLLNAEQTLQEYISEYYDDPCNRHDEIIDLLEATFRDEENDESRCFPASSISSEGGEFTLDCEMEVTYEIGSTTTVTAEYTAINIVDDNGGVVDIVPNLLIVSDASVEGGASAEKIQFVNDCTENDFVNTKQILETYIVNQLEDCNNQLSEIISLMEDTFGVENCNEFSSFPQDVTVTCTIEDGTGRGTISAKLIAPYNEDDIATPGAITLEYGGGIVGTQPVVEFSNDCTGDDLQNVLDLLKDIEPQQTDITCNSHSDVTTLLEDTFGVENCVESDTIDNEATWICSSETTEGTTKITTTATYTASDVGGSFFSDTFDVVSAVEEGEGGFSGIFYHDFVNDCTTTDMDEITNLLGLKACNSHSDITTLLEDTFGAENCVKSDTIDNEATWICSSETTEGITKTTNTATYTASDVGGSFFPDTFDVVFTYQEGDEGGMSGYVPHGFVNDCTTTDIDEITELLSLGEEEEECPGQYEIVTLLEETFGEENCESAESSTGFTWVCKRRIDHEHAFKGVVDEVWVATYESKFPSENSVALPYNLKLESVTVFEEGNLYNDEGSNSYTIDSIDFVNDCTTVDVNKTKDLLKWVTNEKEEIIGDNLWSDYFYCVWAHWFDKEKCSAGWEDWISW